MLGAPGRRPHRRRRWGEAEDATTTEPAPFAVLLKRHRLAAGLTQEALAERAGLSARAVSDLERDTGRLPRLDSLALLAAALGLSPEQQAQLRAAARPGPGAPVDEPGGALPVYLTSFVGREAESTEVAAQLARTRLLTLTGAGGCGKTRLAVHVAAGLTGAHPAGVWFVDLAPLADPALVPQTVLVALGLREAPGRAPAAAVAAHLRGRAALLLLDNCEHLVAACAHLTEALLRACPGLRVLATSREALGLAGEVAWRVPSLTLPDEDRPAVDKGPGSAPLGSEAVELFAERARTADPGFAVTTANALTVARICRRLDGIPLALELAAARLKVLDVEQIAARLDDRFRLLTGGSRTALPRQQTLRATLDWSFNLLSETERRTLRRLAVFVPGCTLEAAEAVCADGGQGTSAGERRADPTIPGPLSPVSREDILDLLSHLVDKSLVLVDKDAAEPRYRLLETIRQYGRDRLVEADEARGARERHRDWFLGLAARAEPELLGPRQVEWLNRLEAESDNLRAALEWSLAAEPEIGAWLAGHLWSFWYFRSRVSEGVRWLDAALAVAPRGTPLYAKLLAANGLLLRDQVAIARSKACSEEALALGRLIGADREVGWALNNLGNIAVWHEAEPGRGRALLEESVRMFRVADDRASVGMGLRDLAAVALVEGDDGRALALFEESLAILREIGDAWNLAWTLAHFAELARQHQDHARARAMASESLSLFREIGTAAGMMEAQWICGDVARVQGESDHAMALLAEALAHCQAATSWNIGPAHRIDGCLISLGKLAIQRGDPRRGIVLIGAGQSHLEIPYALSAVDRAENEASLAGARSALGEDAFTRAWAEGEAMSRDQAIAYALQEDCA